MSPLTTSLSRYTSCQAVTLWPGQHLPREPAKPTQGQLQGSSLSSTSLPPPNQTCTLHLPGNNAAAQDFLFLATAHLHSPRPLSEQSRAKGWVNHGAAEPSGRMIQCSSLLYIQEYRSAKAGDASKPGPGLMNGAVLLLSWQPRQCGGGSGTIYGALTWILGTADIKKP